MEAILLYTQQDSIKNEEFIDMFLEEAKQRDIQLDLVTGQYGLRQDIDFVINRTRDHYIARAFEEEGIPVFNSSQVTEITNDKWATYDFLKDKIPCTKTYKADTVCPIPYPVIVKPRHGHGGTRVTMARNDEQYINAVNYTTDYSREIFSGTERYDDAIVQPLMTPGRDMRVYIMGKKIIASVMRTSETDFRSNFSLGGHAELAEADRKITDMVDIITDSLDFGLAGIDFMFDKQGNPYLNEIEDAVGTRMLYSLIPDINIPAMYLDYIAEKIKK